MRGSDPTERKCLNLNGLPSTSIQKPLPRQRVIPATTGSSKINSRLIGGESEWGDEGEIVDKAHPHIIGASTATKGLDDKTLKATQRQMGHLGAPRPKNHHINNYFRDNRIILNVGLYPHLRVSPRC